MQLIAISGKRRTGKTTLANLLRDEYGYCPISLADPLKQMVRLQFGLSAEQTDGKMKEMATQYPDQSLPGRNRFLTPRDIMIMMGQFYRSVDQQFWVNRLFQEIRLKSHQVYVIPDVRFKNELNQMKKYNAVLVRLERDESLTGSNIKDSSETELDDYKDWDIRIPADQNVDMSDLARIGDIIHAHVTARTAA